MNVTATDNRKKDMGVVRVWNFQRNKPLLCKVIVLFACIPVVLLALTACTGKTSAEANTKRMEELGNEFIEELSTDIVAQREKLDGLLELDAVVVTEDKTYHIEKLENFYDEYKVGGNTQLTTVFKTKSFVVTRIVFEGSAGYYFRYEFDQFNETSIVVSSQSLDKISIAEDTKLNKIELTLMKDKKAPIVFTYKNIVTEESQ